MLLLINMYVRMCVLSGCGPVGLMGIGIARAMGATKMCVRVCMYMYAMHGLQLINSHILLYFIRC